MSDLFQLAMPWWEFVLRAVVVYAVLLLMVRLSGKRTMGQFTPFDMILIVLLGNAVQNSLLGKDTKTRFRPHYFGYTEPSFEVDLSAKHLPKVNKEWIEIGGCGMVDPSVFEAVGYDPEIWTGYAFGMGLERLAMLVYGIDDIRYFYQNDVRFLKQFA